MNGRFSVKGIVQKPNKQGLAPVYIQYIYDRKPIVLPVGFSVALADFDTKNGFVKSDRLNAEAVNSKIRIMVDMISKEASSMEIPDRYSVKEAYLKAVTKQKQNKTLKHAYGVLQQIELDEALTHKQELSKSLEEVDAELARLRAAGVFEFSEEEKSYRNLLSRYHEKFEKNGDKQMNQIKSWASTIVAFSDYTKIPLLFSGMDDKFYISLGNYLFKEREYYNSTFGQCIKRLQTFLRYVRKNHKIQVNSAFEDWVILEDEPPCEYLTDEEINLLYNDYKPLVTEAKQRLIDVIVFQCLCGFRYSDLRLSQWKIENDVLMGYPKKQNKRTEGKNIKRFQIPLILDYRIKEILERYNYNMNLIVDQDYNRDMKTLLKKFFEHYKINQYSVTYYKYRFQKQHVFTQPKHELFSSHSCRRSFINRWSKKYDDSVILRMLGSSSLKELQRYKNKSTEDLVSIIKSRM